MSQNFSQSGTQRMEGLGYRRGKRRKKERHRCGQITLNQYPSWNRACVRKMGPSLRASNLLFVYTSSLPSAITHHGRGSVGRVLITRMYGHLQGGCLLIGKLDIVCKRRDPDRSGGWVPAQKGIYPSSYQIVA